MKRLHSGHMTLIELTCVLFFLMFAMATIMGLFTKAYSMSSDAEQLTRAVQLAQSTAALIEGSDHPARLLAELGYIMDENQAMTRRTDDDMVISVRLDTEQTEVGSLHKGTLSVETAGKALVTWPVARYIIRK